MPQRDFALEDRIRDLFHSEGGYFNFGTLEDADKRRLSAAYIRRNPDIVGDLLADVPDSLIAEHMAELAVSVESCDLFDFGQVIHRALQSSTELESLIDGEIDNQWSQVGLERAYA